MIIEKRLIAEGLKRGCYMVNTDNSEAKTKRCYSWEQLHIRPRLEREGRTFRNRKDAKRFAKLCAKVAVKRLSASLSERQREHLEAALGRFAVHITTDSNQYCWANHERIYHCGGWGWCPSVIAHEVAHWIDAQEALILSEPRKGHGMDWLGWYVFLLEDVVKVDREQVRGSLKASRLRFSAK